MDRFVFHSPCLEGPVVITRHFESAHFLKQRGKNVDMPNQDRIVDGASVGDDQPHPSESQALQIPHIAAHVLNGDVRANPMGL